MFLYPDFALPVVCCGNESLSFFVCRSFVRNFFCVSVSICFSLFLCVCMYVYFFLVFVPCQVLEFFVVRSNFGIGA